MMSVVVGRLKGYLTKQGFTLNEKKARFLVRLWVDVMAMLVYSTASIVLMWRDYAGEVVVGLNALCLLHIVISNAICASEVTNRSFGPSLEKRPVKHSYYREKTAILAVFFAIISSMWIIIFFNGHGKIFKYIDYTGTIFEFGIKIVVFVAISLVFLDNVENNLVCAYDASIG